MEAGWKGFVSTGLQPFTDVFYQDCRVGLKREPQVCVSVSQGCPVLPQHGTSRERLNLGLASP